MWNAADRVDYTNKPFPTPNARQHASTLETISLVFFRQLIPRIPETADIHQQIFDWLNDTSELPSDQLHADGAISIMEQGVSFTHDSEYELHTELLGLLGPSYENRFKRLGDLLDLDKAAECHSEALSLYPNGHAAKDFGLSKLRSLYDHQFKHLDELVDLDQAIDCPSQAVFLTPDGHPERSVWPNELGTSQQNRFHRLREAGGIDRAIECHRQALVSNPDPDVHSHTRSCLNGLDSSLISRFRGCASRRRESVRTSARRRRT
jgi:tetratricopeptide (TPR) repeat protein